jgi:hypothetical protein
MIAEKASDMILGEPPLYATSFWVSAFLETQPDIEGRF